MSTFLISAARNRTGTRLNQLGYINRRARTMKFLSSFPLRSPLRYKIKIPVITFGRRNVPREISLSLYVLYIFLYFKTFLYF